MSEPPDITGRILVASSSPLTVNALSKVLESDDVEVVKARHGDEAVSCLLDVQIDLAFVQDILPGRTGLEICEQFARGRNDRQIPFVVFSRRPDMKQAALECGAVGFLKVPCRPEDVFDVIRNLDTPLTAMPSPSEVTRPDLPLKEVDATQAHPMILLVDDSDMIHNHVETIFKDTGYLLAHA